MACEYICDGCGKRERAQWNGSAWFKPHNWFSRHDKDGPQDACSRICIDKVAKEAGKTALILPI